MKWALAFAALAAGCALTPKVVIQPPLAEVPATGRMRAGVAETDITPPPDLPLFGHSQMARVSHGYWTRLRCRSFVLEDPGGRRLALIQLDLGAASGLLHRELAKRTAQWGLGPADLLLLATHTHAGPGGFFGAKFYNAWGAAKPGFEPALVDHLVNRIALSIEEAIGSLEPATIAIGVRRLEGLTRNRSLRAWERNVAPTQPPYAAGLLADLWAIRIDRVTEKGSRPLGALFFFPSHATAVEAGIDLYHGDIHGVASILLAREVQRLYGLRRPFVAGFAAGPEGDVSPAWRKQGKDEATRLGTELAGRGLDLLRSLEGAGHAVTLKAALVDLPMQGQSADARLCPPLVGTAVVAGADDGRSYALGLLGFWEGRRRQAPKRCQAEKVPALGCLQRLLIRPADFPEVAPLHAIAFGDTDLLLTVPGEPTTEAGRLIVEAVRTASGAQRVFLAAHGSDYLSYFTTPAEYAAQHYEGASTLYGPATQPVFAAGLAALATGGKATYLVERVFRPGRPRRRFATAPCDTDSWHPIRTEVQRDASGWIREMSFTWRGLRRGQWCGNLLPVRLRCMGHGGKQLVDDDMGLSFEVRRHGRDRWQATWRRPVVESDVMDGGMCWMEVGPIDKPLLTSERVEWKQ